LHTDSLLDKRTVTKVKSTLAKLSKGSAALDDAYRDALQRIKGQLDGDQELAKKVISWITFAKRPLTATEICCALAIELEDVELDSENIPNIKDLVSVCAGLVIVDKESDVIRLVHYTTQEYFERIREQWNPRAQSDIASTCLTYLSFNTFKSGSCSTDEEFKERLEQSKFLDYAAKYWGEHAITAEGEVCELACSFLLHSKLVLCAAQVLLVPGYHYEGYSQAYPVNTTGLHLTARFGLSNISETVLLSQVQEIAIVVTQKDSYGQTPLHLAAENGHNGMAKLLLDRGADVNAQDGEGGDALQAASAGGHEHMVRLLLDKGADWSVYGGEDSNALRAASAGGHEQIVRLLLDKGADVNAQVGIFDGNALQAASAIGHKQIVELLLDSGADVNAPGKFLEGNALQAASAGGHKQIVELLLERDANVNAQSKFYDNALRAASAEGHEQIVELLLNRGANRVD
jgi:ankyrin repeat protein